jgi:serine/threonine protein kinase
MALSSEQFLNQVVASELLAQEDVAAVISALPEDRRPKDGEQLARELVRQKKLTKYQAEQIYSGKGKTLILGNYVVLDKLGQGGMGVVLKAEHKRLKRLVALKVMSPNLVKTPDALKRFHREVEAAAKLRHTNVVATDDADEAKGTHFLVMEYVEGSDLSALVKKNGPMSVSQAVQCILQAARGLEYAHKQGVVHRDIKPANLLLDTSGTVKILDMGLARIEGETGSQGELTSTGAVMGTVDYMAPEQAMSTKHADARSDVYSLGISLWYLLAGRCAYEGDSLMAKLLAHRDSPIPSLCAVDSEIPAALDVVFRKMVAKQSIDRYQSMTEVIRDLESCQEGSGAVPGVSSPNHFEDPSLKSFLSQLGGTPSSSAASTASRKGTDPATRVRINPAAEATMLNGSIGVDTDPQTMMSIRKQERQARRGNRVADVQAASPPWYFDKRILLGGAAAAALILVAVVILMRTPHGTLRVEILDPDVEMKVKGTEVTFRATDIEPVSLVTGDKKLVVTRGDLSFETEVFALKKGEETRVKVELIGDQLIVNEGDNKIGQQLIAGNTLNSSTTGAAMNSPAALAASAESPPAKPAETRSAVAAAENSIDLLALVDLQRDVGVGNWKKVADGISCENAAGASVLQLPYEPAEEYDFEVEFTATGTGLNINQYVSAGGKIFAWKLNSHNVDPPLYGFELLDGKFAKDNKEAAVQIPESIVVGQRYRSTVEVRRGALRTLLDGKELVKWSGDFSRFSTEPVTPMKHPGRIGIGSWRRPVTFHSVRVREVSGKGRNMVIASPDPGENGGWQTLFNGKDLGGWKVIGVDGWTVENGVLTGRTVEQNSRGWLMSDAAFSDYELELEYKLSSASNSGLFPRALPNGDISGKDFVEIQLLDDTDPSFVSLPADKKTGSIFARFAPEPAPVVPPNQWHRVKMQVRGQNVSLTINDVVILKQGLPDLPLTGHIGLQLYPTQVEFRNVRVRQ